MKKPAGRPKTIEGRDVIDLDECIRRATEELGHQPWCRRTLRNKISRGEFDRFGTYRHPQVDWNQVKRSLHWRSKPKVG